MFKRRRGVQCGVKTTRKKNWCKDCSTKDEQRTRWTKTKKAVQSTSCHGCYQTTMLSARRNFTVSLRYYQDIFFALLVRLGEIKLLIHFVFSYFGTHAFGNIIWRPRDVRSFRYKQNWKEEQEILDRVTHFNSDHPTKSGLENYKQHIWHDLHGSFVLYVLLMWTVKWYRLTKHDL